MALETTAETRLAEQWPKRCTCCGEVYDAQTWRALTALAGTTTDEFCTLEYRNCPCGTTLAVMTAIHDLSKE